MNWWEIGIVIIITFCGMEGVAWGAHKYVMHGFLWSLHKDHHVKEPGFLEKNDIFFLIFAIPSWLCIMLGVIYSSPLSITIGSGIAVYGAVYFLVHEVLIHRRIKLFRNIRSPYLRSLIRAHKMHHKHLTKEDGENFGMLLVPKKYLTKEREMLLKESLKK